MISPTVLFNMIMGIIGSLSVFGMAYVATSGGPAYATWFYVLHLFTNAFQWLRMGYASALAWLFFVIVLIITLAQFRLSNRWVFYASEAGAGEVE
jgi:multiple sugar transport system permease protein